MLGGGDGVHVASAPAMKCEEVLTSNDRFSRITVDSTALVYLRLSVRNARATACLPDQHRQVGLQMLANQIDLARNNTEVIRTAASWDATKTRRRSSERCGARFALLSELT